MEHTHLNPASRNPRIFLDAATVLAALSGAIYIPCEVANLWRGDTWLSFCALALNLWVVAVMVVALLRRRRSRTGGAAVARKV